MSSRRRCALGCCAAVAPRAKAHAAACCVAAAAATARVRRGFRSAVSLLPPPLASPARPPLVSPVRASCLRRLAALPFGAFLWAWGLKGGKGKEFALELRLQQAIFALSA